MRELNLNEDWDDQRLSKFRAHHRRKLPELNTSHEVTVRNKSVTKSYMQPNSSLNTKEHSPSELQREDYISAKQLGKNSHGVVKNPNKFISLESSSPSN